MKGQPAGDGLLGVVGAPAYLPAARPARPRLQPAGPLHAVDPAAAGAHPASQQPGPRYLQRHVDDHSAVQSAVREDARQRLGLVHRPGKTVQDETAAADVRRVQPLGHQRHHELVVDQLAAFHHLPGPPARR
jgi:hypothetical protein